jgi:putative FmdB family regulatory protein
MPTYEYECTACNKRFEVFQSIKDDPVKECPVCGKDVRRIISGGLGVIFHGSGFYSNDAKVAPKEAKKEAPKPSEAPCAHCEHAKSGECGAA